MDFQTLIRHRYSVRAYRPHPVPEDKLALVLEAARWAPTAANRQPFQLYVIKTEAYRDALLEIYDRNWFVQAPLVICACGVPSQGWVREDGTNYTMVDVAIVVDHLTLAAADMGLGTCWIASFNKDAARRTLALPATHDPIVFTPLGYPASQPAIKERKALDELVVYK